MLFQIQNYSVAKWDHKWQVFQARAENTGNALHLCFQEQLSNCWQKHTLSKCVLTKPLYSTLVSSHFTAELLERPYLLFTWFLSSILGVWHSAQKKKKNHTQNLLLSFERIPVTTRRYMKAGVSIQAPTCQTAKGELPAAHLLHEPDSHQCENEIGERCNGSQPYCKSVIFHAGHLQDGCAVVPASKEQTGWCW